MIKDKESYKLYIREDAKQYDRILFSKSKGLKGLIETFRCRYFTTPISDQYAIWTYIKTLRKVEYLYNCPSIINKIKLLYYLRKLLKQGRLTGFQIPLNSIEKGLTIYHYGTIIINQDTKIGENCVMRPDIVIGHKYNGGASPTIGNNVTINSGVRIFGDINIGDDVIIAPNAVVTKDIPSHSIVAGVPATIIKSRKTYNTNWKCISQLCQT